MDDNVKKVLNDFGKYVVTQSRSNLSKKSKNVTKELYESIAYDLEKKNYGYEFSFEMQDYGKFIDEGVKGANPNLVKNGRQKAPLSRFKYRNKMPPLKHILSWVKNRGIRFRNQEGKFKKGTYKTIAFIIQKRVFAQGIEATEFFTKPFNVRFYNLDDEILLAFNDDLDRILKEKIND